MTCWYVDLTDETSVQAAARRIRDAYGRLDLVVNAAGVMLPNPLDAGRTDEWTRMIDTNITGVLRIINAFRDDLLAAAAEGRPADLVNISSVGAHLVLPQYAVYNATKAAITHLSATLRAEFSPRDVRVTNIEPGLTRTELGGHIDNPELSAQLDATFEVIPSPLTPADIADLRELITTRRYGCLWSRIGQSVTQGLARQQPAPGTSSHTEPQRSARGLVVAVCVEAVMCGVPHQVDD